MSEVDTTVPTAEDEVARGVKVSVLFLLTSKVAHVVLNVVSSLAIIRYLTPSRFGDYVLVGSLVTLFGILCDFGIDKFAIREISLDGSAESEVTGTVVVVRLALAVISFLGVQAVLGALGSTSQVHVAAAVASGLFVVQAALALGIAFAVRIQGQFDALSQLAGEFVETGFTLWLVASGATLVQLFTAPLVGGAVAVLTAVSIRRRYRVRVGFARSRVRPLVRGSLPLAIAGVVGIVLLRLDTVMLAALRPAEDVGIFGAAFQPVQYVLIANVTLVTVLLPVLSRYHAADPDRFVATYRRGTEAILAFVVPVAVVLAAAAGPGIRLAYSASYDAAADPFRILLVAMVLLTLTAWEAVVLLAAGHQDVTVKYNAVAVAVGVVLHAALIPSLGPRGAALGTLGIATLTAVWSTTLSRRLAGARNDARRIARVFAANAPVAAVVVALPAAGVNLWVSGAVAVVVYAISLKVFRVWPPKSRAAIGSIRPAVAR